MPRLVAPDVRFQASFVAAWAEFGGGDPDGWSTRVVGEHGWDLARPDDFAAWVQWLLLAADPTTPRPADRVPATARWVVEGEEFLGAVHLRHGLTPFLEEVGGHIGYGIRPSARRRGLATLALRHTLAAAARIGISTALVTCADDNVASARTIERCGGVLVDVHTLPEWVRAAGFPGPVRRYHVPAAAAGLPT